MTLMLAGWLLLLVNSVVFAKYKLSFKCEILGLPIRD